MDVDMDPGADPAALPVGWAAALAVTLTTGTVTADQPDTGRDVWRSMCAPSGYYEMTVLPDGSFQPTRSTPALHSSYRITR